MSATASEHYFLNRQGHFEVVDYNRQKPFSNFFPGIAGLWGVPMWVFYVNRGQCVSSFGIEAKDKAIMEFQPANKAYRLTSLQGFRTFVKAANGDKTVYWEPFQWHLPGTLFQKTQRMAISAHDLTITETNDELGLEVEVNYFTMPQESYAALVRRVTLRNIGPQDWQVDLVDGMPVMVPFGQTDWLNKNMSRTVEAWVKVRNLERKAPYYQLNVEVADTPQVTHIREGNFYFAFQDDADGLLDPVVEAAAIFGPAADFSAPARFMDPEFALPRRQQTSNRTPSAMVRARFDLAKGRQQRVTAVTGFIRTLDQLNAIVDRVRQKGFIDAKASENEAIINDIKNYALTHSSSHEFNLYATHTFLDNILRGGLPISLKTRKGAVAFNVYSRKHGDLERDYNHFVVAPTYYSQGNGNYRDVNQNRRNDVWFNTDVRDQHLITFLNLTQADGYNPLVVKGTSFSVADAKQLEEILAEEVEAGQDRLRAFLSKNFLPGVLLHFVEDEGIQLKGTARDFLARVLTICQKQELADHGEGFWTDHWTYNLDLIESYLRLYPEDLGRLLLESRDFSFYHNTHYVLPRDQRYVLTDRGVRQYESVKALPRAEAEAIAAGGYRLRVKEGEGAVYQTHLTCKLLCLIANKIATLDPSGVGVEMEADKPNWYDSLNGLPGLLGSSISETLEIQRFSVFLLEALKQLSLDDNHGVAVFEELATFISGLNNILALDQTPDAYWVKSNDVKEHYRQRVRLGIQGQEKELSVQEIKHFLTLVIEKTKQAEEKARTGDGCLGTYFYHEVTRHEVLNKGDQNKATTFVRPLAFQRHTLPLFLEGYVHALRVGATPEACQALYQEVRQGALFDRKLRMYKVNADLSAESEEIGRTRVFPPSWLENESIWLHMEYKFVLELLRKGLYKEFYDNFRHVMIPFLRPETYGRSILENSSFLVSSVHEDAALHGQGFVARLSGSTAEFLHMWLYMNAGPRPFTVDGPNGLVLRLEPILAGWLFTEEPRSVTWRDRQGRWQTETLPKDTYAFNFLGGTLVVYHNPGRKDTYGQEAPSIHRMVLSYYDESKRDEELKGASLRQAYASAVRSGSVRRLDAFFGE